MTRRMSPSSARRRELGRPLATSVRITRRRAREGTFSSPFYSRRPSNHPSFSFGLCTNKNDALGLDFENSVTPFNFKITKGGDLPFLGFAGNTIKAGATYVSTFRATRFVPTLPLVTRLSSLTPGEVSCIVYAPDEPLLIHTVRSEPR
jgi:hypothetical protein